MAVERLAAGDPLRAQRGQSQRGLRFQCSGVRFQEYFAAAAAGI
jgi:hypothetical protein